MTRSGAVVDHRPAFLSLEKRRDVGHADFHFEAGGHAVQCLEPTAGCILSMLVQVDETGRDHQAVRPDDAFARERLRRDPRDPVARNSDIADGVET